MGRNEFDPDKITIDDARADRSNNRDHPEYLQMQSELRSDLHNSEKIKMISLHEAGHLIYFRRAGVTEFEFVGPTITFDGTKFGCFTAAINPPQFTEAKHFNEQFVRELARAAAAGGVFLQVLLGCPEDETGDGVDKTIFEGHCSRARWRNPGQTIDPHGLWQTAQAEVRADLENHVIDEDEIHRTAAEVIAKCFRMN